MYILPFFPNRLTQPSNTRSALRFPVLLVAPVDNDNAGTVRYGASVGVKSWVHGPDTHSVDHEPIMGRCLFTENVYVATGFNSQGIQLGPGIGR